MIKNSGFTFPKEKLSKFCKKHHVRKLGIFGSVLTSKFRKTSDIDVLVEFEKGHVPGLAFFTMQDELSQILGRTVDLNTPNFLSPYFRRSVQSEARVLYGC